MTHYRIQNLGGLGGCTVSGRADFDRGLVLLRVVDDMKVMLSGFVDRQAGSLIDIPLATDGIRPLVLVVTITLGEFQILQPPLARYGVPALATHKPIMCLGDDVAVFALLVARLFVLVRGRHEALGRVGHVIAHSGVVGRPYAPRDRSVHARPSHCHARALTSSIPCPASPPGSHHRDASLAVAGCSERWPRASATDNAMRGQSTRTRTRHRNARHATASD